MTGGDWRGPSSKILGRDVNSWDILTYHQAGPLLPGVGLQRDFGPCRTTAAATRPHRSGSVATLRSSVRLLRTRPGPLGDQGAGWLCCPHHASGMMPLRIQTTPELLANSHPPAFARSDFLRLLLLLAPALLIILGIPGFVTQDGPAHVYNAEILRESLTKSSESDAFPLTAFDIQLRPVPNWAGHALLMGWLSLLPPRAADLAMIVLTLLGPAFLCAWLARLVSGRPLTLSTLIACALVGLNLPWLWGFYSFLFGSITFLVTVGIWWQRRDRPGPGLALLVGTLLVFGYFCHPISLALTVLALGVLAALTPGPGRSGRGFWTLIGLGPLVPLGFVYRRLMGAGGQLQPAWAGFSHGFRPASVLERLLWIDPITIGRRTAIPFSRFESALNGLVAPVLWLALGLVLIFLASYGGRVRRQESAESSWQPSWPWLMCAGLFLGLGFLAPDSLGQTHGHYLTQRLTWMGLLILVPALASLPVPKQALYRRLRLTATACLAIALVTQTAFVADYARESSSRFQAYSRARPEVGQRQRMAGLFLELRGRFRANPLLHLDCWLGVGTQNVVWSNYEAAYYYFPVQVKPNPQLPPVREFEAISILDGPEEATVRLGRWKQLLETYHESIDRLVIWGHDRSIEKVTANWYTCTLDDGMLQVWVRHDPSAESHQP